MIKQLQDNRIFINYGPIQMAIEIYKDGKKNIEIANTVAKHVVRQFEELVLFIPNLKKMKMYKEPSDNYPKVLNKMILAVEKVEDKDLNTLAAVAGSFSEIALEKALEMGADRVIINNGGDIALKDLSGNQIKVGIPINIKGKILALKIKKEDGITGICTSGFGGRSFTKGIATAVVVMANKASIADACATHLANMVNVEDENIIRCLAEEIDSETDIKGQLVTMSIGQISDNKKNIALYNGIEVAEKLYQKGMISGAVLCIDDKVVKYPNNLILDIIDKPE